MNPATSLGHNPYVFSRRDFARLFGMGAAGLTLQPHQDAPQEPPSAPVAVVAGRPPGRAIPEALELLGQANVSERDVYLKASYNSADPYPAATAPETLQTVVRLLRDLRCRRIRLIERSGMGQTAAIWAELGVRETLRGLNVELLPLEALGQDLFRRENLAGWHWKHGVEAPGFLNHDACIVQICNLKTHRFGGIFSASLKNSIGLIAKRGEVEGNPYNYMLEFHSSPDQRLMIAEVNQLYKPAVVIMDAMQAFVDGGPERGRVVKLGAILAGFDRIAIDAVGLALLRLNGAGRELTARGVFEQEQIKRAVEIGLGIRSAKEIKLLPAGDEASRRLVAQISANLLEPLEEEKPVR